jgi:hypothetical protein
MEILSDMVGAGTLSRRNQDDMLDDKTTMVRLSEIICHTGRKKYCFLYISGDIIKLII